jgi:predicted permease
MATETLRRDLRYALRKLTRSPGFTASAVLTIALGIGANTAVFSLVDEILLRPIPVPDADRLTAVYSYDKTTASYLSTSYPDYEDLKLRSKSLEALAAYVRIPVKLGVGDYSERVAAEAVSSNYFSLLRLVPVTGRVPDPASEDASTVPTVMIGERLWTTRFNRDPGLIGKTINIEEHPVMVGGVVPEKYRGANLNWSEAPEIWIPLASLPAIMPQFRTIDILHQRNMRWLLMLGRLRAGVSTEQSGAEFEIIASGMSTAQPADKNITALVFPASRAKFWPAYRQSVATSLAAFSGAACLVLLLACANVCNLLLAKAISRRREIAIRISLGVSRAGLIRQLLTENLLLIIPGFLLALVFGSLLERLLVRFPNGLGIPLALEPSMDVRAVIFCGAISLLAVMLFGLAPAIIATRSEAALTLKESGNNLSAVGSGAARDALVLLQVALSTILLIGGGLFTRSLVKAYSINLGFETANVITAGFDFPREGAGSLTVDQLLRGVSEIGGVESATVVSNLPLSAVHSTMQVADSSTGPAGAFPVSYVAGDSGWLSFFHIPMIGGREFDARDGAAAGKVAVVNETLARQLAHGANPVGRSIVIQQGRSWVPVTIIGVSRDTRYGSVWDKPASYLWLARQQWPISAGHIAVRTRIAAGTVLPEFRAAWKRLAPRIPLYDVRTVDEQIRIALAPQRLAAAVLGAFGGLAGLLAAIGLYGLLAYSINQRRREIAIRMAVGAGQAAIIRLAGGRAIMVVVAGAAVGCIASVVCVRLIASQVKGISPYDLTTFAAVAALLASIALGAILPPVFRATRADILKSLRLE